MTPPASAVLIRDAVHGQDSQTDLARSNRRFMQVFDRLVYNQIWEDPVVDLAAMEVRPHHRIVTICSAGCNALSYLTADPAAVFAVDLNFAHLALAELKRTAFDVFNSADPVRALFVTASGDDNHALLHQVVPKLSQPARQYWQAGSKHADFTRGFFKTGLLGKAIGLARVFARVHGVRLEDALTLNDADRQREWARIHVRPIFEGRLMSALFSLRHPLFLLGIPPRQFNLLCDGDSKRMAHVLADRVEQLAGGAPSSQNYFLWQAFARHYQTGPDAAVPLYLEAGNFQTIKERVARLTLHHGSLTDHLAGRVARSLDRYVLLDAQDWMDQATHAALWAQITRTARPGARVIFRTAGTRPTFERFGDMGDWHRWRRLDETSRLLHARDRSGIYGGFHVYELAA